MDFQQLLTFTDNLLVDGLRMGLILGAMTGALVWPFFGASERVIVRVAIGFFGGLFVTAMIRGPLFFAALAEAVEDAPPNAPIASAPGLSPAFSVFMIELAIGIGIGTYLLILIADPPRFVMGSIYGLMVGMGLATLLRYGWAWVQMAPGAYPFVVVIIVAGALSFVASQVE